MKPIGLNSKGKMDWKGWAESLLSIPLNAGLTGGTRLNSSVHAVKL
jgi:hypothetical protein